MVILSVMCCMVMRLGYKMSILVENISPIKFCDSLSLSHNESFLVVFFIINVGKPY